MPGYTTNGLPVLAPGSMTGLEQAAFDTELTQGVNPESVAVQGNALGLGWQTVAAAGATQGTAGLIGANAYNVVVTVTASTEGVKLPAATTGLQFRIIADTAIGVKVYSSPAGTTIGTATTNTTAFAVAKTTVAVFIATSKTKWRVLKGG